MQPPPSRPGFRQMGVRRFGRVNWLGLYTLARREVMRFMNVWQQTVLAPLMTAGLFVVVFALALGKNRGEIMGLPYLAFLGPGILMMTVIQNAFANTSSSIISAKMQGNIVDTLMPPLSAAVRRAPLKTSWIDAHWGVRPSPAWAFSAKPAYVASGSCVA